MNACDCKRASHEHGTRTRYIVHRCRCDACREAVAEATRARRRAQLYGRYHLVDAEPARAHVRALMAQGMGWKQVMAAAGLYASTGTRLLYGRYEPGHPDYRPPAKQINRDDAAAILAVRFRLAEGASVPAIGTRRRLQALVATGWSQSQLAGRLGMGRGNFAALMRRDSVQRATAAAVREVYDELWDTPPVAATRFEQAGITRALRTAAAEGWPPPLAWDDDTIDDPAATPASEGWKAGTIEERAESLRELADLGVDPETAALRLGWNSWNSAFKALGRAGLHEAAEYAVTAFEREQSHAKGRVA